MQSSYAYTFRGDKQVPVVSLPVLAVSAFAVLKEYKSLWVICLAVSSYCYLIFILQCVFKPHVL